NRNFPTRDWHAAAANRYYPGPAAASEPETAALMAAVASYRPAWIVTVHAPLALVNYDGPAPAADLAAAMARACNRQVAADIGYLTPGSFGTYYGKEQGIPVITLETAKESAAAVWHRYGTALLAAVTFRS